ncbi:hypothetical protein C8F01DRAFT_31601 [Mycena amicta]|nr:hypothetical protein C8F01DRAFT_31601 [Mycena amicta]
MADSGSFLISKRAAAQGRNMHVFSLHEFPAVDMAGGFNLNRFHLPAKTFYRWLDLVDADRRKSTLNLVLRRITLRKIDVLSYAVASEDGAPIPRGSDELILPGVYGVFLDGKPYRRCVGNPNSHEVSFLALASELDAECASYGEPNQPMPSSENTMPQSLAELAMARDQGRCCVTGRTDLPTQVIWAYPPLASYRLHQVSCVAYHRRVLTFFILVRPSVLEDVQGPRKHHHSFCYARRTIQPELVQCRS